MSHKKNTCFDKIDTPSDIIFFNEVALSKEANDFCRHFMMYCFFTSSEF